MALIKALSGGVLIFARLAIWISTNNTTITQYSHQSSQQYLQYNKDIRITSSNLINPNGNLGSLSSTISFIRFSRLSLPSQPIHPHCLAKSNISVRYAASWRGPVHRGPDTISEFETWKMKRNRVLYTVIESNNISVIWTLEN